MPYSVRPGAAAPVIETRRLRLRPHQVDDLRDCAEMWADPRVTRFIGGTPATRHEAWARMLKYAGLWSLLGFGYWALTERATGRYIGELGFAEFIREIEPPIQGTPELGWALIPAAHGQGYATEAVGAAVAWGEERFGREALTVCIINPDNLASVRIATKCGYGNARATRYAGEAVLLYTRGQA